MRREKTYPVELHLPSNLIPAICSPSTTSSPAMNEELVREQLVILVESLKKLKAQVNRYRHERNLARESLGKQDDAEARAEKYRLEAGEARERLQKREEENNSLRSELDSSRQRERGLRLELDVSHEGMRNLHKELKRLLKMERIHDIEHRSSTQTRHLIPHSASLELKVLSMLQSTRKRMAEFKNSSRRAEVGEQMQDLRSSLSPSPTRNSFTIESLASSNPEDLVEKDEIKELEGSVELEISQSIFGIDGLLDAEGGENEESCHFALSSLGSLMSEKRMSASMGWGGGGDFDSSIGSLASEKKRMNASMGDLLLERRHFDASRLVFDDDEEELIIE